MDSQLAVLISTIAAAVSAVFAAVSSIMTYRQYRKSQLQKLSEKLAKILEISVQYPYVENPGFTSQWEKKTRQMNGICAMTCIATFFSTIGWTCTTISAEIKRK